jgi:hypothetical protein
LSCNIIFDEFTSYDETGGYPSVICPKCGSDKKEKLASACNFNFSNPVGTDRWNSENSGHDYRFKHNLPSVIEQRKKAEIASKSPNAPYNEINDLNKNEAWDGN